LLLKEFAPEAYNVLKDKDVSIYMADIPAQGMTEGSRVRGMMGDPIISVNKKYVGNPFWTAVILRHEAVHAQKLPANLNQFVLKHSPINLVKDLVHMIQ